jgi:broad specificity phosphatase PhoE
VVNDLAGDDGRPVTTLFLARHGETDWNRDHRVQGHTDIPLNETGRAQAQELSRLLLGERFDAVYSSDLSRAYETALFVAESRGQQVMRHAGLREKNYGSWEGLTDEQVLERHPEATAGPWGDGETTEQMTARVLETLREIAASHDRGRVLVVFHGGPIRAVLRHASLDGSNLVPNCHVLSLVVRGGEFRRGGSFPSVGPPDLSAG